MVGTLTLQTVEVKLQALTAEAFQPYGKVLGLDQPLHPETEVGRLSMDLLRVRPRSGTGGIPSLASHPSYNQIFFIVRGSLIMPVAPAPRNLDAPEAEWEFDWDGLAAFVVNAGQALIVNKGTWHTVVGIGEDSMMAIVGRDHDMGGKTGNPLHVWLYDAKRDNRVIQLVV